MQISAILKDTPREIINRVIVIDAGCQGPYGHHMPANELIGDQCRKSNIEIKTLVNVKCPEEVATSLRADSILPSSTYLSLPSEPGAALSKVNASNEETFKQLLFQGPKLKSGDLVILHTASFWHLLGIFKWRKIFLSEDIRFSIVFRFPPLGSFNISGLSDSTKSALLEFCSEVMNLWKRQKGVALFTDSRDILETYRRQLDADIRYICMPLHSMRATETSFEDIRPAHKTRFIFPGAARKEKGIDLLANMIPHYLEKRPETEFVIQSLQGAPGPAAEKLGALSTNLYPNNVRILGRPLSGKGYFNFLASASAVLLPYNQIHYEEKSSQIFYESLAAGRPVIVTSNTSMAAQLSSFDQICGLQSDESVDGFIETLLDFETKKETLAKNAGHAAKRINSTHNETRFFDSLFFSPLEIA